MNLRNRVLRLSNDFRSLKTISYPPVRAAEHDIINIMIRKSTVTTASIIKMIRAPWPSFIMSSKSMPYLMIAKNYVTMLYILNHAK